MRVQRTEGRTVPGGDQGPLRAVLQDTRAPIGALLVLSLISNLLILTGPLFMLQVYDRVLPSRSLPTLVALFALVALLYGLYAVVELLRTRITIRIAALFDASLRRAAFDTVLRPQLPSGMATRHDALRDLATLRQFIAGGGPLALLDLPWLPIYVALVFLLHPDLGWLAVGGAGVLAVLLLIHEARSGSSVRRAQAAKAKRQRQVADATTGSESLWAMGMTDAVAERWQRSSDEVDGLLRSSGDATALYASITKGFRFLLQSAVLALGAFLVIEGQLSPGLMIAASIVTSRALAPIEQVISQWRGFVAGRQAWRDLTEALDVARPGGSLLPLPRRVLTVSQVAAGPIDRPIVTGVNFSLAAGEAVAVLGRSGSGKSTLARTLVWIWPPFSGEIRLDDSELAHFDRDLAGRLIGYLPQAVDLLDGTVAENIARFERDGDFADVLEAARLAGTHEMIAALPDGYETVIGPHGRALSAGQRQRIGLARALYRKPFLLVLDEPNANLDADGDLALSNAIEAMKAEGSICIVVSHRPGIVAVVDKVLFLQGGKQAAFGPRDEVLARITHPNARAAPALKLRKQDA